VAFWNLDTRPVTEDASGFLAGGVPLRFFHFSAYDPDEPHLLSRHQGERPRVLLSEHPALRRLCDRYAARLVAEGWPECRKLAYGFDEAANGLRLDLTMRRVFRQEVLRREQGIGHGLGRVDDLPDPFDPGGADDFVALLRSPFPDSEHPRVSRYVHALYVARPDLQRSFPDLSGLAGNHFLWWLREMGAPTLGVPGELVPTEDEIRRGSTPPGGADDDAAHPGAPHDVRVVGYLAAELGIGESGRALVAGVEAAGERVAVLSERATANRQQHDAPVLAGGVAGGDGGTFGGDIDLVCVNADRLPAVLDRLAVGPGRRAYTVGMWSWEVEHVPPLHARAAGLVDEVWACSVWAADAIRRAVVDTPVHAVPNPVVERPPRPRSRAQLGLPDGFVFLFCFDFFSVAERKNPLGALEAFRRAFTPGEGPQLVLKSINGSVALSELERLRVAAGDRPDVHLVDGYLDAQDQRALVAGCDAYVSLHRAEGFGYTMAEAMLLAKPVIATGYSGNLEFMDERNSFLVGHEMVTIPEGCEPYPAGAAWADPDVDEAAAVMRRLVEDPAGARAVGRRARDDIRRFHSPAARAPLVAARLAASRAALADRRVARARARPSPLVRAGRRAARGAVGALRRAAG
jgi:glycosyltransferase involved in cell wall biosynthesis